MSRQQRREVCRGIFVKQYSHLAQQFRKPRRALLWRIRVLQMGTGAETHQCSHRLQDNRKRADRNTGTDKHQTTAEYIRVSVRDIGKRDHGSFSFRLRPNITVDFERPETEADITTRNACSWPLCKALHRAEHS